MSDTMLMQVNQEALSKPENIDCLIEAANDILSNTSLSFEEMKKKKWYNRLWEMVTFSKDNEKKLAKGVSSLAQVQAIVLKMLMMLSRENTRIAGIVAENSGNIERLAENVLHIAAEIDMIKAELHRNTYFHERIKLSDISDKELELIYSGTIKYTLSFDKPVQEAQEYIANFRKAANMHELPDTDQFDYDSIGKLSVKASELYYTILCEITALMDKAPDDNDNFEEATENATVSTKKQREIWGRIVKTVKLEGKKGIAEGYYEPDIGVLMTIDSSGVLIDDEGGYPKIDLPKLNANDAFKLFTSIITEFNDIEKTLIELDPISTSLMDNDTMVKVVSTYTDLLPTLKLVQGFMFNNSSLISLINYIMTGNKSEDNDNPEEK
jgi:hypothetical protein